MAATIRGKRIRFPRIPMFRVFYSLTYTLVYLVTVVFLAITPISMIYGSIQQSALQYTAMIGAGYVLLISSAIFIYSSRLYTNRATLSAVGKAYIPIEDGEIGKMVRKMIVKQLERSAIVAWESRPRDLYGEILLAEQEGILPPESRSVDRDAYYIGTEIRVDPQNPPWGDVQHPGWSSPSHSNNNTTPDVQFDNVIAELPNLIEAQAVSLAPPDPMLTPVPGEAPLADLAIADLLRRPANVAMREYLTHLSYLGLVDAANSEVFLSEYERARFSGKPVAVHEFDGLMTAFSELLAGMKPLDRVIVDEIRTQTEDQENQPSIQAPSISLPFEDDALLGRPLSRTQSLATAQSNEYSHVTALERHSSREATPYIHQNDQSMESFTSVIHKSPAQLRGEAEAQSSESVTSHSSLSDSGSVLRHHEIDNNVDQT